MHALDPLFVDSAPLNPSCKTGVQQLLDAVDPDKRRRAPGGREHTGKLRIGDERAPPNRHQQHVAASSDKQGRGRVVGEPANHQEVRLQSGRDPPGVWQPEHPRRVGGHHRERLVGLHLSYRDGDPQLVKQVKEPVTRESVPRQIRVLDTVQAS